MPQPGTQEPPPSESSKSSEGPRPGAEGVELLHTLLEGIVRAADSADVLAQVLSQHGAALNQNTQVMAHLVKSNQLLAASGAETHNLLGENIEVGGEVADVVGAFHDLFGRLGPRLKKVRDFDDLISELKVVWNSLSGEEDEEE